MAILNLVMNVLVYGARMMDPTIGRFVRVDPKADLYVSLNPYNYVGNNPLIRIDPTGEYIIILGAGGESSKYFQEQLSRLFNNNVKVSFSQGGEARLILEKTGELNKSQQAAYDILSGYANDEDYEFTVSISGNDPAHDFEAYDSEKFDPFDFDAYPAGDENTRGALAHYVHFFAEQYYKEIILGIKEPTISRVYDNKKTSDLNFLSSHEYALAQEELVSGVKSINQESITNLENKFGAKLTQTLFQNFKNGKVISSYIEISGGFKPKIIRK